MADSEPLIRVMFVIPSTCNAQDELPSDMLEAFNACKMNGVKPTWIKELDNKEIDTLKTDFIVFPQFEGSFYKKVLHSKSVRILAPLCLLHCLNESKAIPNSETPLVSLAMQDCCVVGSTLSKETKRDLKFKVQAMGGVYSLNLVSETTYLVTNAVKSEKYIAAAELGIKVMRVEFIDALWEASARRAVHASDEEFQMYKCPVFHNLNICSSGFPKTERKIPLLVNEHGGNFSSTLVVNQTDILVCKSSTSEKYKTAMKCKIDCVTEDWIYDSIAKGYALPNLKDYTGKTATSTPTKREFVDPNFSMMSVIATSSSQNPMVKQIEETMDESYFMRDTTQFNPTVGSSGSNKRKSPKDSEHDLIDKLDIKKAKLSEPYLDGCVVYTAGFKQEHNDKLSKIINFSGATRCDNLNSRITHAIIGNSKCAELKQIKIKNLSCSIVNVTWLIDSMNAQMAMDTEKYLISTEHLCCQSSNETTSSPLSKKGLNLLRKSETLLENHDTEEQRQENNVNDQDEDLMKHYLNSMTGTNQDSVNAALAAFSLNQLQAAEQDPKESCDTIAPQQTLSQSNQTTSFPMSSTLDERGIFANLKFAIVNYTHKDEEKIITSIKEMQGTIVSKNYEGIPDYAIVPVNYDSLQFTAGRVVTDLWISDCAEQKRLITELEFYHSPFSTVCNALEGLVISMTGLKEKERKFLTRVVVQLGGKQQDCMARTTIQEKKTLATTHLISNEPSGKKYNGAIKWGLPVVDKAWLFKCAEEKRHVDEYDYLLGESKDYFVKERIGASATAAFSKLDISVCNSTTASFKTPITPKSILTTPQPLAAKHEQENMETPNYECKISTNGCKTPENKDSVVCSQVTPVSEVMARVRAMCGYKTPNGDLSDAQDTPPRRTRYDNIKTPEAHLGAFIQDPPPPELRKQWAYWLKTFPSPPNRGLSTPLAEIKKQFWANLNTGTPPPRRNVKWVNGKFVESEDPASDDEIQLNQPQLSTYLENNTENATEDLLLEHIGKLESHLMSSGGSKRPSSMKKLAYDGGIIPDRESQPLSVGWDENMDIGAPSHHSIAKPKIFMISGMDESAKSMLIEKLENLGATASSITSYDPSSTHLLCETLNRNEKALASMAAGLWILHISYVDDSAKVGHLLNEEEYEFGNPKAMHKFKFDADGAQRAAASRYWRQEINRRGYGAFHDIRAIVVSNRKEHMIRVLQAGGAMLVDVSPPFDDNVSATHCFSDPKNFVNNLKQYIPLAQQGILCVNTLYVNDFLNRTVQDINEYIIPSFNKYYSK